MKFIRQSFLGVLLFGAIGLWVYRDLNPIRNCAEPLKYTLGSFDQRFGISKTDLVKAIKEAENIWENATGKNLFAYDPNPPRRGQLFNYVGRYFIRDDIPVNLVYDERQQLSQERQGILTDINQTKMSADAVKQQFISLQEQYKEASAEYQQLVLRYRNHKVSYETVEAKRLEVNSLADQVNALVRKYNSIVKEINANVGLINETAGTEFEEGQYISDEKGGRINIYEFANHQILVRVLAHELGHALGLEHNDNPDSIMYYLNNSPKMVPTKDDLADLNAICKRK